MNQIYKAAARKGNRLTYESFLFLLLPSQGCREFHYFLISKNICLNNIHCSFLVSVYTDSCICFTTFAGAPTAIEFEGIS